MIHDSARHRAVISDIDALNADDPRIDWIDGGQQPREVVYSVRMSDCLSRIYPDASEELCIAARAQHIGRWQIPRQRYPLGRDGYQSWRTACREHHVVLVTAILNRHGFTSGQIAQVAKMISKVDLKRDHGSQALENVAAVVFITHYLEAFAATHKDFSPEKIVAILRKTLRKLDAVGHAAVRDLPLPPQLRAFIEIALT